MFDLSTLSSGKSVHPNDRCLTTLGSLAHVLCGVLAGRLVESTYVTPTLPVVSQRSGTGRYTSRPSLEL